MTLQEPSQEPAPFLPVSALSGVAALVKEAARHTQTASAMVSMAVHKGDKSLLPAFDQAQLAAQALQEAARTLKKVGVIMANVTTSATAQAPPMGNCLAGATKATTSAGAGTLEGRLDLSELARMESPKMRELLALLDEAQAIAEEIDAERGRVLPDDLPLLPGESRGTDLAEDVSNIAVRVRREVHGASVGRE